MLIWSITMIKRIQCTSLLEYFVMLNIKCFWDNPGPWSTPEDGLDSMVNSRFPLKKCHEILISTDKYCLQCRFDELNIAMFSYFKKDRELTSDITIPGTASTSGQYSLTGNTWNVTTFVIWMYCTWNIIHLKLNWNYFYRSSKIISKILNSTR